MPKTRWEPGHDAFLGRVVYIRQLSTWKAEKWAGMESKQKDYVAHLTNVSPKYRYERTFLKKHDDTVLIPCDRLANGAVIEVRLGGEHEYFRVSDGELIQIDEGEVRGRIATWLVATGQSLANDDEDL